MSPPLTNAEWEDAIASRAGTAWGLRMLAIGDRPWGEKLWGLKRYILKEVKGAPDGYRFDTDEAWEAFYDSALSVLYPDEYFGRGYMEVR